MTTLRILFDFIYDNFVNSSKLLYLMLHDVDMHTLWTLFHLKSTVLRDNFLIYSFFFYSKSLKSKQRLRHSVGGKFFHQINSVERKIVKIFTEKVASFLKLFLIFFNFLELSKSSDSNNGVINKNYFCHKNLTNFVIIFLLEKLQQNCINQSCR